MILRTQKSDEHWSHLQLDSFFWDARIAVTMGNYGRGLDHEALKAYPDALSTFCQTRENAETQRAPCSFRILHSSFLFGTNYAKTHHG